MLKFSLRTMAAVRVLPTIVCVLAIAGTAVAQTVPTPAPTVIPVYGAFRTADGQPRTGSVTVIISLYDAQEDATPRWLEQQLVTLDAQGRYNLQFGATRSEGLPPELFTATPGVRWIGVAIEGEAEQPRMPIVSVPYAANAASAETLAGKPVSDFVLASTLKQDVRAALDGEDATSRNVTGRATNTGYIAKFSNDSGSTENSNIFQYGTNIGIGTTTAGTPLHVAGMATMTSMTFYPVGSRPSATSPVFYQPSSGHLAIATAETERIRLDSSGRFGIGTSTPVTPLHVNGMTTASGFQFFPTSTPDIGTAPAMYQPASGQFAISSNGAERLRLDGSGNFGIGTAAPTSKLHVVGSARVTGDMTVDGNIAARYQDVAEWVDAAGALPPGTVVTIDPTTTNRVRAAARAYDTGVAGAVSPQPGVVLGEPGEGRVLVAQSGRVRVNADARFGAIRPGDLLVTSPTKGHVMRAQRGKARPGTIVGKALEALPAGRGQILILLTLQ